MQRKWHPCGSATCTDSPGVSDFEKVTTSVWVNSSGRENNWEGAGAGAGTGSGSRIRRNMPCERRGRSRGIEDAVGGGCRNCDRRSLAGHLKMLWGEDAEMTPRTE